MFKAKCCKQENKLEREVYSPASAIAALSKGNPYFAKFKFAKLHNACSNKLTDFTTTCFGHTSSIQNEDDSKVLEEDPNSIPMENNAAIPQNIEFNLHLDDLATINIVNSVMAPQESSTDSQTNNMAENVHEPANAQSVRYKACSSVAFSNNILNTISQTQSLDDEIQRTNEFQQNQVKSNHPFTFNQGLPLTQIFPYLAYYPYSRYLTPFPMAGCASFLFPNYNTKTPIESRPSSLKQNNFQTESYSSTAASKCVKIVFFIIIVSFWKILHLMFYCCCCCTVAS